MNSTSIEKSLGDDPARTQLDDSVTPPGILTGLHMTVPPPEVGNVHEKGKPATMLHSSFA